MTTILSFLLLFSVSSKPPGTIRVNNYYVDKTEVNNGDWVAYVNAKKQELAPSEWYRILPLKKNNWYALPNQKYTPIVLITYQQAVDYCAWRSKVVSEKKGKKITYRLPTPTEWKEIAEELTRSELKRLTKEYEKTKGLIEDNPKEYLLIEVVDARSRIYNMFDNVSEMTSEPGVAMGSNNSQLNDFRKNLTMYIEYDSPNNYLGFRCIAEME